MYNCLHVSPTVFLQKNDAILNNKLKFCSSHATFNGNYEFLPQYESFLSCLVPNALFKMETLKNFFSPPLAPITVLMTSMGNQMSFNEVCNMHGYSFLEFNVVVQIHRFHRSLWDFTFISNHVKENMYDAIETDLPSAITQWVTKSKCYEGDADHSYSINIFFGVLNSFTDYLTRKTNRIQTISTDLNRKGNPE